jgi:hypothetical protein
MIMKVISGGQTGVDRAALDVAMECGIPVGGWCPRGRLAEDGQIPDRYPLIETTVEIYAVRTEWNVRDSDATLIITRGAPTGGTALTCAMTNKWSRPCYSVDLLECVDLNDARKWLTEHNVSVLNVAGPRESTQPGIYAAASSMLAQLLHGPAR